MTVTLNTVTANAAYQPYVPTVAQSATAAAALSSEAVSLSAQSAVVASLGGSTGAAVYSPSGLLNSLQQAGEVKEPVAVPADGSDADTTNRAQDALDQGILSSLNTAGAGIYNGSGTATAGLSDQAASNWADLLKTNPDLAGTVIASSFEQGIVSTLHVTA
ncbi:hypothetical protein FHW58_005096 [Duganella sp. 1224]|uniref:hypothetical protein n=1 Tax=Duganella sp. 1224 TaxID=2587052 RepID=UPI0015CE3B2C|nr:hypothetical protein [Duganella sp. 1224]NYE63862.1 hypothetical protein [Duganella sp. 1224]